MGPAPTPTPPAEGCYSHNYKDCIPDRYTSSSCDKVWLPNGTEQNCVLCGEITLVCKSAVGPLAALVILIMLNAFLQLALLLTLPLLRLRVVKRKNTVKRILIVVMASV